MLIVKKANKRQAMPSTRKTSNETYHQSHYTHLYTDGTV